MTMKHQLMMMTQISNCFNMSLTHSCYHSHEYCLLLMVSHWSLISCVVSLTGVFRLVHTPLLQCTHLNTLYTLYTVHTDSHPCFPGDTSFLLSSL